MNARTKAVEVPSAVKALNPRSAPASSETKGRRDRGGKKKRGHGNEKSVVLKAEVEERTKRRRRMLRLEEGSKAKGQCS